MNSYKVSGNLTRDPETFAPQGSENTCIKFTIANNDESKKKSDGSGYEDIPSYFDVKYWTKNVQYWIQKLTKGVSVTIQGRLKQERWPDKNDSTKTLSRIMIIAEVGYNQGFAIVVHPKASQQQQEQNQPGGASTGSPNNDEDECPF